MSARRLSRAGARAIVAAALLAPAAPVVAHAAARVSGTVNTIQRPLGGASVIVLETGLSARTDSLGRYELAGLGPGVYSLRIVAVGYRPIAGVVTVGADSTAAPASWLLKPYHPDGAGLTHGFVAPRLSPATSAAPAGETTASAPAESVRAAAPTPPPAPPQPAEPSAPAIAPVLGLYLSPAEQAARADWPGPLGELLPRMETADSLTAVSAGTSEPGEETWAQWADRFGAWIVANPGHARAPLARRAVAYARTRRALAAGATWGGYQAARVAREALAIARPDATDDAPGGAFLDSLGARLDAVFVPGSSPPKPVPAPRHRARHHRKRRAAKG